MSTVNEYSSALAHSPQLDTEIDNVIDTALALNRIVGAVLVVAYHGEIVYQRAAGFADREARRLATPDTIFRLASITKPIVSAAALALVEQGKLGLDDPVTKWLPEFRPTLPNGVPAVITIRQLLTHTSGLSYGFQEAEDGSYHRANVSDALDQPGLSIAENLRRLASAPLVFEPGTSFQYSLALDVLGEVLTRVQGVSLPEVTAALVTEPLGMRDTSFWVQDPATLAAAYSDGVLTPVRMNDHHVIPFPPGAGVSFAPGRALDPASYPSGGAGMVGTAGDFVKFLETLRTGGAPILRSETVKAMTTNQTGDFVIDPEIPGWGFGFGAAILLNPILAQTPQSVGTYRWGGAYGHSWFVDPQLELTVVALTNTAFEGMAGGFRFAIRDAIYRGITE
ncbi:MAG: beta-lactamase family protein [Verrucomicrobia bacterium]|nr:beta-lactamase family protein [Verrucomicrobiota bacterium]